MQGVELEMQGIAGDNAGKREEIFDCVTKAQSRPKPGQAGGGRMHSTNQFLKQFLSLPHLLYEDNQEMAIRAHARGCIPPLHLPPPARTAPINCGNTFSSAGSDVKKISTTC